MDGCLMHIPHEIAEETFIAYSLSPGSRFADGMPAKPLASRPLERTRGPAGPPNGDRADNGRICCGATRPAEAFDDADGGGGAGSGGGVARREDPRSTTSRRDCGGVAERGRADSGGMEGNRRMGVKSWEPPLTRGGGLFGLQVE